MKQSYWLLSPPPHSTIVYFNKREVRAKFHPKRHTFNAKTSLLTSPRAGAQTGGLEPLRLWTTALGPPFCSFDCSHPPDELWSNWFHVYLLNLQWAPSLRPPCLGQVLTVTAQLPRESPLLCPVCGISQSEPRTSSKKRRRMRGEKVVIG